MKIAIFGGPETSVADSPSRLAAGRDVVRRDSRRPRARRSGRGRPARGPADGNFVPMENVAAAGAAELAIVSIPWEGIDADDSADGGRPRRQDRDHGRQRPEVRQERRGRRPGGGASGRWPNRAPTPSRTWPRRRRSSWPTTTSRRQRSRPATTSAPTCSSAERAGSARSRDRAHQGSSRCPRARRRAAGKRADHRGHDRTGHQSEQALWRRGEPRRSPVSRSAPERSGAGH